MVGVAEAQATRTWVSGVGDDANPCSRTAPCKTYAGAISKTAAGGEISTLDPGGFGAINITKSITIQGTGTLASMLNSGTNGVIVNGAGIIVVLRDLSINGAGTTLGVNGVRVIQGAKLIMERVNVQNQSNHCVTVENNATTMLTDVTLSNCAGIGFSASPTSPPQSSKHMLNNVRIIQNGSGITMSNGATGHINNCVISHNTNAGLTSTQNFGVTTVNVYNTEISANGTGIIAGNGGSVTRIAETRIFNNTTGFTFSGGGQILTFGDNHIGGNGVNQTPSGPAVPGHT
jgi:hypothetical protein